MYWQILLFLVQECFGIWCFIIKIWLSLVVQLNCGVIDLIKAPAQITITAIMWTTIVWSSKFSVAVALLWNGVHHFLVQNLGSKCSISIGIGLLWLWYNINSSRNEATHLTHLILVDLLIALINISSHHLLLSIRRRRNLRNVSFISVCMLAWSTWAVHSFAYLHLLHEHLVIPNLRIRAERLLTAISLIMVGC